MNVMCWRVPKRDFLRVPKRDFLRVSKRGPDRCQMPDASEDHTSIPESSKTAPPESSNSPSLPKLKKGRKSQKSQGSEVLVAIQARFKQVKGTQWAYPGQLGPSSCIITDYLIKRMRMDACEKPVLRFARF